jgi:hypothetical protein
VVINFGAPVVVDGGLVAQVVGSISLRLLTLSSAISSRGLPCSPRSRSVRIAGRREQACSRPPAPRPGRALGRSAGSFLRWDADRATVARRARAGSQNARLSLAIRSTILVEVRGAGRQSLASGFDSVST